MKIFLSWSGKLSKQIAREFEIWIPTVVPHIDVFYSKESLEVGRQWIDGLNKALEDVRYGISIITQDNLQSPWINYEAGAIFHKSSSDQCILIPILIDVNKAELTGPLGTFQAINFSEQEIRKLVLSLNENLGEKKIPESMLDTMFNIHWKEFNKRIGVILEEHEINFDPEKQINSETMLKRIYEYTRTLAVNNGLEESKYFQGNSKGYDFKSRCERYIFQFISDNELFEENYIQNFLGIYNHCNMKLRAAKIVHTPFYLKETICSILDIDKDQVL